MRAASISLRVATATEARRKRLTIASKMTHQARKKVVRSSGSEEVMCRREDQAGMTLHDSTDEFR